MVEIILLVIGAMLVVCLILLAILLGRKTPDLQGVEQRMRQENTAARQEASGTANQLRTEVLQSVQGFSQTISESLNGLLSAHTEHQRAYFTGLAEQLEKLLVANEKNGNELRETVERRLKGLQEENILKLEEMRKTVDEKLQGTLEKRLGESFQLVSQQLKQVHESLGEMQKLAIGVGDLKKVLTNIKTRGGWGEVQLGGILAQILSPEQYAANVATKEGSAERVEFALKLPGRDSDHEQIWLPIDAKFPKEDYERLVEAAQAGDVEGLEVAGRQLEIRVRACAKDIRDKYVNPPRTTDFGLMFLPTEGLYAEVLRRPGLAEALQQEYRVVPSGPTTLVALLNSLQMGFRTLAIEKRSSEVWKVLGAVKAEFERFGGVLDRVKTKLQSAGREIEAAETRTRVMGRKLREVETLPADQAREVLSLIEAPPDAGDAEETKPE